MIPRCGQAARGSDARMNTCMSEIFANVSEQCCFVKGRDTFDVEDLRKEGKQTSGLLKNKLFIWPPFVDDFALPPEVVFREV